MRVDGIFTDSALWAKLVIESTYPSTLHLLLIMGELEGEGMWLWLGLWLWLWPTAALKASTTPSLAATAPAKAATFFFSNLFFSTEEG